MYHKTDITTNLLAYSEAFVGEVRSTTEGNFATSRDDKWSVGQHLDHLIRSVKPLNLAFRLPKLALRLLFGKPKHPSRSYDEIVQRYHDKLATGAKATGRFVPQTIKVANKNNLLQTYMRQHYDLDQKLQRYPDADLDKYLLPHPILGKLTLREMLFFTAYHTQHHTESLKKLKN